LAAWVVSFPEFAYETRQLMAAAEIRRYCRKAHLTTKAGTLHCLNGNYEGAALWSAIHGVSGCADGIRWTCRKVDDIRNIYLQF